MATHLSAISERIFTLCKNKRFDEARHLYMDLVDQGAIDDRDPRTIALRASIEGLAGNLDREIELLEKARTIEPQHAGVNYSLARSYIRIEKYAASLAASEAVIKIESKRDNQPFTSSSIFLAAYSLARLKDETRFKYYFQLISTDQSEWVRDQLISKKDLELLLT